jgi:hypothetical protein
MVMDALDLFVARLKGLNSGSRVAVHAALAREMWFNNPSLRAEFISLAIEHEVLEWDSEFQPAEPQTHNYPGCGESLDLTCATLLGMDVYDQLTPEHCTELLGQAQHMLDVDAERVEALAEDAVDMMAQERRERRAGA